MSRRLALLGLTALLLAGLPATAEARPFGYIESRTVQLKAREIVNVDVTCDPRTAAVAGFLVAGQQVFVFESTALTDRTWRFRVQALRDVTARFEVRCGGIRERGRTVPLDTTTRRVSDSSLEPGETLRRTARCRSGHAPVGTGYRDRKPGGQSVPDPGSATNTTMAKPERGRVEFEVANTGLFPVAVDRDAVCAKRSRRVGGQTFNATVVRRTRQTMAPEGARRFATLDCGRGGVALGGGWDLPDPFVSATEGTPRGADRAERVRQIGLGFFNQRGGPKPVAGFGLCLSR